MIDLNTIIDIVVQGSISYAPKLLLVILTIAIGFWIVKKIVAGVEKGLAHKRIDVSLRHFLESLISIILKILILLAAAGMVGIETTSFVALLAAAGFAIGLALQGSLANFAGGVMLLLFKPYKVGDFVQIAGESGTVNKIDILATVLKTPQNVTIFVPNGAAFAGNITNYSAEKIKRLDMTFGIGYESDLKKAKEILQKLLKADKRVLNEPAEPAVLVSELADSSVNLQIRAWLNGSDLWGVHFDMMENVKLEFDKAGISIPYPQMVIHKE